MSECFVNPVVGDVRTLTDKIDYKYYKPGDLRLYGRPADFVKREKDDEKLNEALKELEAKLRPIGIGDDIFEQIKKTIDDLIEAIRKKAGVVGEGITVAVFDGDFYHFLPIALKVQKNYIKSIGVIYGYAYEGHCYKLPKPQIMCLSERPTTVAKGDCGFDPAFGYAVWSIDKLERAIVLDIRADDLKTLVLDENLPGNRSPLAYAQAQSLAPQRHRD